ncbi:MAG: hypothetical protein HYV95_07675 [Opitutae bacterium]|nr:hypothetical protein [Opitutae bacterium]
MKHLPAGVLLGLVLVSLAASAAEENKPTPAPSDVASPLAKLEAIAPKEWPALQFFEGYHADLLALAESNTLNSGNEFFRAAKLATWHGGEYRITRVRYELALTAIALGEVSAEGLLPLAWDDVLQTLGRPLRFDIYGMVARDPDFAELSASPTVIQGVWRDPAAARKAAITAQDNLSVKEIVDADQAVRKAGWNNLTQEQMQRMMQEDRTRNRRIRAIVAAGELHTADDFARASLVLQHSDRFAGYQLAHELAVCSLLLGDRKSGRWLVAATYDRMLKSAGHPQRFGTQFGPTGRLTPVDEAGICDHERTALGCPPLAESRARKL